MNLNTKRRVLAIGIDAAEPALIRRLIEQRQLPALTSLLRRGQWLRVQSPAQIGSGCVWPSFATGEEPLSHGIYGEWCWQAEKMSLKHYSGADFEPFWKTLSDRGFTVGVLDAPFVKPIGLQTGFEIVDWGAHDALGDGVHASPAPIAELLTKIEPHPLSINRHDQASSEHPRELQALLSAGLRGVELRGRLARRVLSDTRPDFALIVFPEFHHAAHHLWHTVESAGTCGSDQRCATRGLEEVIREIDQQIAKLVESMSDDDAVMVFSLHGMRPAAGVPSFLAGVLCEKGFSSIGGWQAQSLTDKTRSLLAQTKRFAPQSLKRTYYRVASPRAMRLVAAPNMLPVYNWSCTRAFSLPTDQHGWIRINLKGREAAGIVAPEQYDEMCAELEDLLRSLQLEDGARLACDVIRTAANLEEARASGLPDLVVHWSNSAFAIGSKIKGSAVMIQTTGKKFTGQHARDGFCIFRGSRDICETRQLAATDMHLLIAGLVT